MDKLDAARRSENMRRIRSKDMAPEIAVRSLVHRLGYRFRLHGKGLPGKPDVVLRRHKKIVLVHGCFWHQHAECREGRLPGTRREYWVPKLARNQQRDSENIEALRTAGWRVFVVWECETKDLEALERRLQEFLRS